MGVERVRNDLADDRLLEGARVGVPQILEEVEQVDAGFAHPLPRRAWVRIKTKGTPPGARAPETYGTKCAKDPRAPSALAPRLASKGASSSPGCPSPRR